MEVSMSSMMAAAMTVIIKIVLRISLLLRPALTGRP
jgi:hypothetical protein